VLADDARPVETASAARAVAATGPRVVARRQGERCEQRRGGVGRAGERDAADEPPRAGKLAAAATAAWRRRGGGGRGPDGASDGGVHAAGGIQMTKGLAGSGGDGDGFDCCISGGCCTSSCSWLHDPQQHLLLLLHLRP